MFTILSNVKMDARSALQLYRERDSVEKFFDDMKEYPGYEATACAHQ